MIRDSGFSFLGHPVEVYNEKGLRWNSLHNVSALQDVNNVSCGACSLLYIV